MASFIKEAERIAAKIDYFYNNAGSRGYDQATNHFDKLPGLIYKAMHSKRYSGEAPFINRIRKDMQPLMDEMLERKRNQDTENR